MDSTIQIPSQSTALLAPGPNQSIAYLERVLRQPALKAAFGGAIGYSAADYTYNPIDVTPRLDRGVLTFELSKPRADSQWNTLRHLCMIITCAANQHNPFELNQATLPLTIQRDQFDAIQADPLILPQFLIQSDVNPLLRPFTSREDLIHEVNMINNTIKAYIEWIANAIQVSLAQGVDCSWNWGAYFSLTWGSFMEMVSGVHDVHSVPATIKPPSFIFDIGSTERNQCTAIVLHAHKSSVAKRNRYWESRVVVAILSTGPVPGLDDKEVYLLRVLAREMFGSRS